MKDQYTDFEGLEL